MKETGILIISFGSTQKEVRRRSTDVILKEAAENFKDCSVKEAFTGKAVRDKILKDEGIRIPSPCEALEEFKKEGVKRLILQGTFLMEGGEYNKLFSLAEEYSPFFESIKVGKPLTGLDSIEAFAGAFKRAKVIRKDKFTVLAGHGSDFKANKLYTEIDAELKKEGFSKVTVGTLENKPDIDDVLSFLKENKARKVVLMPFLSVAGNHAEKDIFGEENSYLKSLTDAGYQVESVKKGLSEYKEIRELWLDSIKKIL